LGSTGYAEAALLIRLLQHFPDTIGRLQGL
jgi:hypothetical protein